MAENKDGQEKTEDPTGRRLQEARNRGQVSKSTDVTTAGILLLGGLMLFAWGKVIMGDFQGFMIYILHNSSTFELTFQNVVSSTYKLIAIMAGMILPLMLTIFAIALIGEIFQVGFHFANKKFTEGLNFQKVFNPFGGIKRVMFSSNSLVELVKSFVKLILLGSFAVYIIYSHREEYIGLVERPFMDIATLMVDISFEMIVKIGISYLFIALADYFYQKWHFKQEMKMTKQEVKDESKQSEGDQQIKSRMRSIMRSRLRKLMMANVPKADVIITNPTHFAVALKYKPGESTAPIVVAKGIDFLALRIREIATEHDVPIVEEPPLARQLYYTVEVDDEIPEKLFKAVAQVLAYIYQLKGKKL